ncbi:DUF4189 domain-containing protein [Lysobacter sp. CA199]|uniref:DUF4189 domain-containing protein n=1 Tax=Lysobacter sp. CA199 TaxID=3455608 RepID=UPI003F8D160A
MASCVPIPTAPEPRWANRWGAVANDKTGIFGVSVNEATEKRAAKSAIADCKKKGGADCASSFTYGNQCVSIATSDSDSTVARATDLRTAESDSLQGCQKASNGQLCAVYYSACSLPVKVAR